MALNRRPLTDHFIFPFGELLTSELRDSYPYLVDKGWHQVANLMVIVETRTS